jgi:hypothetical protein
MTVPGSSGIPSKRAEAEAAWIEFYRNLGMSSSEFKGVPRLRRYTQYQRAIIKEVLAEVDKRLGSVDKVSVWSAGSGIDTISLYLKSVRGESIEFTIQDISQECVSFNEEMFLRCGLPAEFVVGDLFESKFKERFDIVINTGLLEHFGASDQSRLLRVFSDSLKPGGIYLTATPFVGAKLYSACKSRTESRGAWKVGPETPIMTMSGLDSGDLVLLNEYQAAAGDQLIFVGDAYPTLGRLLRPVIVVMRAVPDICEPVLMRLIGGYCLIDLFSKGGPSRGSVGVG